MSKFDSKTAKVREESAFYKHLVSVHDGKEVGKTFDDYFEIKILKAYKKPFTMCVEEGTFISNSTQKASGTRLKSSEQRRVWSKEEQRQSDS